MFGRFLPIFLLLPRSKFIAVPRCQHGATARYQHRFGVLPRVLFA